jgi:tetratricopeptide (TPR) repeat protein
VAHQLAGTFPDGQLHAALQGITSPVEPGEVLAWFLRGLGMPDSAIPASEAERAARYRTLLAARRMLIVLDDARDAAQVRPLLPGITTCAVIVTSRRALPDLAGAALLDLDVLDQDEARAMFTAIVGPERAAAEPDAAAAVLACCAGLPLAIRIAATRLAARPAWSIASLAMRLSDERKRLNELTAGDLAVRASFAVSYRALLASDPHPAEVFRLLGLAGTPTISLPAVAALAGRHRDEVAETLEVLIDAHLLEMAGPGRYRLHDLLSIYAAELARQTGSAAQRRAAIRRMLDWYCQRTIAANRGHTHASAAYDPPAADRAFAFPSLQEALDWCEAERANLVAATRRAAELDMPDIAAQIPAALWSFFQRRPYQDDWRTTHEIGLECARRTGDLYTEAWLLNSLGKLHARAGRFDDAHRCLDESLAIRRRLADPANEARTLNTIGGAYLAQDRPSPALTHLSQALAIASAIRSDTDIAIVCSNLGEAFRQMRRYDDALTSLQRALTLFGQAGDDYGKAISETSIGETYEGMGVPDEAIDHYLRALAAHRDVGHEGVEQAYILRSLAETYRSLGHTAEARDAWLAALPILDRLGAPEAADVRARLEALTDPGSAAARG